LFETKIMIVYLNAMSKGILVPIKLLKELLRGVAKNCGEEIVQISDTIRIQNIGVVLIIPLLTFWCC
tara:strand:+ start:305 stop:505 length:201 start_codon:yes stop_codon:yes gene_type:complete